MYATVEYTSFVTCTLSITPPFYLLPFFVPRCAHKGPCGPHIWHRVQPFSGMFSSIPILLLRKLFFYFKRCMFPLPPRTSLPPVPPCRRNLRPSLSPSPRPSLDTSPSPRRSPPSSPSPSQHYRSSHNHNRTRPRMVGPSPSTPAGMNYPRTSSSGS